MPLLLIADPDPEMIERYIGRSCIFACEHDGRTIGIAAVTEEGNGTVEIKNLAVDKDMWRCGAGTALLSAVKSAYKGCRIIVGTADTSAGPLRFYESCGFSRCGTIKNFFKDNYPKPVFEGGVQCTDMILLEFKRNA